MHEHSLCAGCAQQMSESYDPDREGWYDVDVQVCAGCQALERAQKDHDEPGVKFVVKPNPSYVRRS